MADLQTIIWDEGSLIVELEQSAPTIVAEGNLEDYIKALILSSYTPQYASFTPNIMQAVFILPFVLPVPSRSRLYLNGIKYKYARDYQILDTVLTWLNPIQLDTNDTLEILY